MGGLDDQVGISALVVCDPLGVELGVALELLEDVGLMVVDGDVDHEVAVSGESEGLLEHDLLLLTLLLLKSPSFLNLTRHVLLSGEGLHFSDYYNYYKKLKKPLKYI